MQVLKQKIRATLPWATKLYKRATAKTWPRNSIVFYTGNHPGGLTADKLQSGASGSETAVIMLSKEWVKQGYQVTVYSTCGDKEGVFEGVEYRNFYHFNWEDQFETLIVWRNPLNLHSPVKAKRLWLEWQDVPHPPEAFTPEKLAIFDKIFVKCHYHRNLLPDLPDPKFAIIPNGIDAAIASLSDQPKDPYRLVYASRYYRGLESMLRYGWPLIKQAIPKAELHLYYGWARKELQPDMQEWRREMLALMQQPGVIDHGMIGQYDLIREKARSAIHYYGCTYEEVDCISVRESAAVGCVPVTTDFAALSEKSYCVKIPGLPQAEATQVAIAHRIIDLLKQPDELAAIRQQFQALAQMETWDQIAQQWLKHL